MKTVHVHFITLKHCSNWTTVAWASVGCTHYVIVCTWSANSFFP